MTKILLDNVTYTQKPADSEIIKINNRLPKSLININPLELAEALKSGRSFVGATLKVVNGELNRRKGNWKSQTVVALDFDAGLTIEEALNDTFFKEYASFMYLTFSHKPTAHKFRVVFILEQEITDYSKFEKLMKQLLAMYPQADKACKDGVRLYFGGTEYFPFDFENKLPINLEPNQKGFWSDREYISYMSDQKVTAKSKPSKLETLQQQGHNNLKLIIENNYEALNQKLNAPKAIFSNHDDAIDYIKKYNLVNFLGLSGNNFRDIFHDDTKPSSSIFISTTNSKHYIYKCHSHDYQFSGSIVEVVQRLQKKSKQQVYDFIFNALNVEIHYNEETLTKLSIVDNNLMFIESININDKYPNLSKIIYRYGLTLASLTEFAKKNINVIDNKVLTYPSIATLSTITKKSKSTLSSHLNVLTLMGLIEKCSEDNIPTDLLKTIKDYKEISSYKYMTSVYVIPEYTSELLSHAEVIASKWYQNGCTIKTANYEGILRTFGEDVANKVFPQDQNKPINQLNELVADKSEKALIKQIQLNGFTTESIILDEIMLFFRGQKLFKQEELKRCISELLDKYGLVRVTLNKQLKEKLSANCKGYPKILLKEDYYSQLLTIE